MNSVFDDIKAKIDIVSIVSGYTKLKKAGRNLKGLCPFHSEKTPSFMVSPDKQIAYCFGCQKGGDVFKFIAEVEHLDQLQTLKYLADKVHVNLSAYGSTFVPSEEKEKKNDSAHAVCEASMAYYEQQLWNTQEGQKVLLYLRSRGLTDETIREFHLGFANEGFQSLYTYLVSKGFTKDELLLSGQIISKSTDLSHVFDRFRLRLMVPIFDSRGRAVGFGGRQLKKGDEPKYLNSPESQIYHKSHVLYGFHFAKDAIREKGSVLVMEGYFDVISAHQAGFCNVVATSGTALTIEQVRLLKRFTNNVYLVFDSDKAGRMATDRASEILVGEGFTVNVVTVIGHKDPDEACKAGDFDASIAQSKYYLDYYFERAKELYVNPAPREKTLIAEYFFAVLKWSQEEIEISHYLNSLASFLHVKDEDVRAKFLRFVHDNKFTQKNNAKEDSLERYMASLEDYFFGFLIAFPEIISEIADSMADFPQTSDINTVYKCLLSHYNGGALEHNAFLSGLAPEKRQNILLASLWVEKEFPENIDIAEKRKEVNHLLARIAQKEKKRESSELTYLIKEAEKSGKMQDGDEILQKKASIYKKI